MKSKLLKILAILMAVTFIGAGVAICGCSSPANNPPDKIENPGDNTGGEQTPENPGENPGGEQTPENPGENPGGEQTPEIPGENPGGEENPENPGDNTGGEQNPENPGGGLVNGGIFEGH